MYQDKIIRARLINTSRNHILAEGKNFIILIKV